MSATLHVMGMMELADLQGEWTNSEIMDFTVNLGEELIAYIKDELGKMDRLSEYAENTEFFNELYAELKENDVNLSKEEIDKKVDEYVIDLFNNAEVNDTLFYRVHFDLVDGMYDYDAQLMTDVSDIVDYITN